MSAGQVVPQQALQGPRPCSLPCAKLSDTLSSPARRRYLRQGGAVLSTERHDFWDSLVRYLSYRDETRGEAGGDSERVVRAR